MLWSEESSPEIRQLGLWSSPMTLEAPTDNADGSDRTLWTTGLRPDAVDDPSPEHLFDIDDTPLLP
jgi:hypothetical protein